MPWEPFNNVMGSGRDRKRKWWYIAVEASDA
jgi:hypothetical protein